MNTINSLIACTGTKRLLGRRSSRLLRRRRHGAIAVEFAIVSPLVFFVIGLVMQFSGLAMSQNVITNAAHEGGRTASLRNTVAVEDVISQVEVSLEAGGVNSDLATIKVSPTNLENLSPGDRISVTVTVPASDLSWLQVMPLPNSKLSAKIHYDRE